MARSGSGPHYFRTNAIYASGNWANWSMHSFVRSSVAPGNANVRQPGGITGGTSQQVQMAQGWSHTAAGFSQAMINKRSNLTLQTAAMNGTLSVDTWYAFGGSMDGSNLRSYLNGALQNTTATGSPTTGTSHISVLATLLSNFTSPTGFDEGQVAEFAAWNVALTADEFNALAKGLRPTRIRPASLQFYSPIVRDIYDYKGAALTVTGTGAATDHPPVFG